MKTGTVILCLTAVFTLCAGPVFSWRYTADMNPEKSGILIHAGSGHGCVPEVSETQKTPDGAPSLALKMKTPGGKAAEYAKQINFIVMRPVSKGQKYRICFWYKGSVPGRIAYNAARQYAPYSAIGKRSGRPLEVGTQWQREEREFTVDENCMAPLAIPRFRAGEFPDGGTLYLGPVTVERIDKTFASLLSDRWNYQVQSDRPLTIDRIPAGGKTVALEKNQLDFARLEGRHGNGATAVLYQEFESPADGSMTLGMSADWWMECFVNGKPVFNTLKTGNISQKYVPEDHIFNVPVKKGRNLIAVRVRSGSGGWRFVCGRVKPVDGDPVLTRLFTPKAGTAYRPINEAHFLEVKPGTALDFSNLVPGERPAGALGRLTVGKNGDAVFGKRPDVPARFHGFNLALGSMMWEDKLHEWDKAKIDRFCDAIERRGYNYVRFVVPNAFQVGFDIMRKYFKTDWRTAKIPRTVEELELILDKGNMDRFDYLTAGLKKRGIYYSLDIAGSRMIRQCYQIPRTKSFLACLFYDSLHREHWKLFAEYLMNRVNRYTGNAYKNEPALILICFINEQDLRFANGLDFLLPGFRRYLKQKYSTDKALAAAWGISVTFDTVPEIKEAHLHAGDRRAQDSGEFLIGAMREMSTWFFSTIRRAGYPGLAYHWDMIMRTLEFPGRVLLPATSQHTYFAHPAAIPARKDIPHKNKSANASAGNYPHVTLTSQRSSLDSSYFRAPAASRFLDRPYFITEISHSSSNRYSHERGLYFASYASLQEWSGMAAWFRTVRLNRLPFLWFDDANSPVSRASETLTALIYLRRDVSPAPHKVALELRNKRMFPNHYLSAIGDEYAKMAFVTRIGALYPEIRPLEKVGAVKPDLVFTPDHFTRLNVGQWFVSADTSNSGRELPMFAELRRKGILSPGNPTDPAKNFYVSETGELTLNAEKGTMKVVTPRLEGAILKKNEPLTLGAVAIHSCTRPATVALASLEREKSLKSANRLLLIFSTNAFNTGEVFDSPEQQICFDTGTPPGLIESAVLDLSFANGRTVLPEVWSLNFDGTRAERIPVKLENGRLRLHLDTSRLKYGSFFFELAYQK